MKIEKLPVEKVPGGFVVKVRARKLASFNAKRWLSPHIYAQNQEAD